MFRSKKAIGIYWLLSLLFTLIGLAVLEGNIYF